MNILWYLIFKDYHVKSALSKYLFQKFIIFQSSIILQN